MPTISLQEALKSVGGDAAKLIGGASGIIAPGIGLEGMPGRMETFTPESVAAGPQTSLLDERYMSPRVDNRPKWPISMYDVRGDDGLVVETAQQQYERLYPTVPRELLREKYDPVLAAFQAKHPGYAQVGPHLVRDGKLNGPGHDAKNWVDPSKVIYDPEYGMLAPAASGFGFAGKHEPFSQTALQIYGPVLAVMGASAAYMALGSASATTATGTAAAAGETAGTLTAIPSAVGPTSAGLVDAASLTGVSGGFVPSVTALGEAGAGLIPEVGAGIVGAGGAGAGSTAMQWLDLAGNFPVSSLTGGGGDDILSDAGDILSGTDGVDNYGGGATRDKITEPSWLDTGLKWMKENPIATYVAGSALQSAFTPNALDQQEQTLKNQMELEAWRRQYADANMNLSGVNVGIRPSGAPLVDSSGNPVHGPGGIVGRRV